MISRLSDEQKTPRALFEYAEKRWGPFDLDAAAAADNALAPRWIDRGIDALTQSWRAPPYGRVWCNPPYSRGFISAFLEKAYAETCAHHCSTVVLLLPADTSTAWFHDIVVPKAVEYEFIRGRVKFNGAKSAAKFPSMFVVF